MRQLRIAAIFYTARCNDGVLEVTYGIHNFGSESDASAYVDFYNAPWASVRQSVYSSVLHANQKMSGKAIAAFESPVHSIKDLGR